MFVTLAFQLSHSIHKTCTAWKIVPTTYYIIRFISFCFQIIHSSIHDHRRIFGTYQLTLCTAQSIKQCITFLAHKAFFCALYTQMTLPTILSTHQCHSSVVIALNASASHNSIIAILTQELFISHCLTSLAASTNKGVKVVTDNLYRLFIKYKILL